MNILLTGASGLVGQHLLCKLSAEGYRIRALSLHGEPQKKFTSWDTKRVEWVVADIQDFTQLPDVLSGIDLVIHTAAKVSYDPRERDAMLEVNVIGTENLVNAMLDRQIPRLIHFSSIAALGQPAPAELTREETPYEEKEQTTYYGKSKHLAELEVWRGMAEGLEVLVLNPGIILGEGDEERSSSNLFHIVRNEFPYYTSGSTGWVDVADLCEIVWRFLHQPQAWNQRYICVGQNASFREVFTQMANHMQVKPPHRYAGPLLTALVWRLYYVKCLLVGGQATITRETAASAHRQQAYDHSRLLGALPGFQFNTLENTLQRILNR